jgi:hypothetical protein
MHTSGIEARSARTGVSGCSAQGMHLDRSRAGVGPKVMVDNGAVDSRWCRPWSVPAPSREITSVLADEDIAMVIARGMTASQFQWVVFARLHELLAEQAL